MPDFLVRFERGQFAEVNQERLIARGLESGTVACFYPHSGKSYSTRRVGILIRKLNSHGVTLVSGRDRMAMKGVDSQLAVH